MMTGNPYGCPPGVFWMLEHQGSPELGDIRRLGPSRVQWRGDHRTAPHFTSDHAWLLDESPANLILINREARSLGSRESLVRQLASAARQHKLSTLAERTGYSDSMISAVLTGSRVPSPKLLEAIAKACGQEVVLKNVSAGGGDERLS